MSCGQGFARRVQPGGLLLICVDDPGARPVATHLSHSMPRRACSSRRLSACSNRIASTRPCQLSLSVVLPCRAVGQLLSQPPADEQSASLVAAMEPGPRAVVTFGAGHGADWQAVAVTPNIEGGTDFVVVRKARPLCPVAAAVASLQEASLRHSKRENSPLTLRRGGRSLG